RRLQPLRPLLADSDRAAVDAAEADALSVRARAALAEARAAVEETTARHVEARQRFEQVCRTQRDAEPELTQAAGLDGQIAALTAEWAAAVRDRDAAIARLAAARDGLDAAERRRSGADADALRLEEWMRERAAFEPVAAQWSRWDAALGRHALAADTRRSAEAEADRHGAEAARLAGEAGRAELELAGAQARLAEADDALLGLQGEAAPSLDDTRRRRVEATERRDRLTALVGVADSASRLAAGQAQADADEARLTADAERDGAQARDSDAERRLRQAALGEAEVTLQRLRLAQREDVASLRARLVPGEACPVCGSDAHPWGVPDRTPLAGLAHDQVHRVAALKGETDGLLARQARHEADERAARAALQALAARRDADRREAAALAGRWTEQAGAFALPAQPDSGAARERLADVETLLARVAADEARALDHRRRFDAAQAERSARTEAVVRTAQAFEGLRRRLAEANHAEALAVARREGAAADRDSALADLAEAFAGEAGWREALEAAPARFRAALAERAAAYQNQRGLLLAARKAAEDATAERAAKGADHEGAQQAEEAARRRADGLAERLSARTDERAALLGGQPVAAARKALDERRREAEARLERATVARQDAASRLSAAEREAETRGEAARACAGKAREAAQILDRAAAGAAATVEEARRGLAAPESELAAEESALAEFETVRRDAALLAAERARLRADHHATGTGRPDGTVEDAAEAAARIAGALEEERLRLGAARGRLDADDRNRARLAGLAAAIAEQRARHELWAGMGQLIGSATGHKMRNFAQSLSLDMLLTHANRHLEDLARRYRLERVAGADLEIQVVDREMGDERRGVHSLSGGELFLVSLALALGLSAMAAGTAGGIGTLFIDEGFGTLDPDSLDVALSCLEALQAGGRQVGVISHVPAMMERIGVQIRVAPLGGGRSRVTVLSTATTLEALGGGRSLTVAS
ncbi:exonuclease, partial [Azospirillum doebereinerae]